MAVSVGTDEATSHEPNPIVRPWPPAISAPRGFAAMAVNHRAEESVRLAMPENMRKLPRRRRLSSPGFAPTASAIESTSGYSTPERAVLLGKAGAMTRVDEKDAVAETERRAAEEAHHEVSEAPAEAALHDGSRHEKRDDDEKDRSVGEARVGFRWLERSGEDRGSESEDRGGQNGKGRRSLPTRLRR